MIWTDFVQFIFKILNNEKWYGVISNHSKNMKFIKDFLNKISIISRKSLNYKGKSLMFSDPFLSYHAPSRTWAVRCAFFRPKILTGALVRDSYALRASNIFLWVIWKLKIRKNKFLFFGEFFPSRLIFFTIDQIWILAHFGFWEIYNLIYSVNL